MMVNLRQEVHFLTQDIERSDWDILRRKSYRRAGYTCEVCGGKGGEHPVECHEVWDFDDDTQTQTLKGLVSLCPPCHQVKHIALQILRDEWGWIKHLQRVNDLSQSEAQIYVQDCLDLWKLRSQHRWKRNLDWLHLSYEGLSESERVENFLRAISSK